jgi:hypothetical protein
MFIYFLNTYTHAKVIKSLVFSLVINPKQGGEEIVPKFSPKIKFKYNN